MKLTIPSRSLVLWGPVTNASGVAQMLIYVPGFGGNSGWAGTATFAWAAAGGEGELLGVDKLQTVSGWDSLRFNRARNLFHLVDSVGGCWEVSGPKQSKLVRNAGIPVIELRGGDWIARTTSPYAGYRAMSGDRGADIAIAFSRPFEILSETEDEQLVCGTPEGLLWLKRTSGGQFAVSGELPLHTGGFPFAFLGEDAQHLYVTVYDVRHQAYFAVVQKQNRTR